jgi:hypothetical protein
MSWIRNTEKNLNIFAKQVRTKKESQQRQLTGQNLKMIGQLLSVIGKRTVKEKSINNLLFILLGPTD